MIFTMQSNPVKKYDVLYIYTDGASRGNPGPAAIAYIFGVLREGKWIEIERYSDYIGIATNNKAEYKAIIKALSEAHRYTRWKIKLYSDSELVIRQIKGEYRIKKEHLSKLCEEVYEKIEFYEKVEFFHVPRENPYIQKCDRLCNLELDNAGYSKRNKYKSKEVINERK